MEFEKWIEAATVDIPPPCNDNERPEVTDAFIIIVLLFIWCWDYPPDHPAKRFIAKFSAPFVYMGFWHGWAMFAPEPIHVNRRLRAVLTFADGVTENWSPLGPEHSGKLINMLYARSFKYEHSLLSPRVGYLYRRCAISWPGKWSSMDENYGRSCFSEIFRRSIRSVRRMSIPS